MCKLPVDPKPMQMCSIQHDTGCSAGSTAANRSAKEQQRKLFQTAEKASRQLHRELSLPQPSPSAAAQGATTAIHKELDALSENFAVLRKLVDNQEVSLHSTRHPLHS